MIVFAIILPMTIAQITDVEKLAKENEELNQFLLERDQKINYLGAILDEEFSYGKFSPGN